MTEEKKNHRSGHFLRIEPESTKALAKYKSVLEAFKKTRCWKFCESLQGGHSQVTKEFSLHFTGLNTKIGILNLSITPEIIDLVTKILRGQERWFKGFRFDMQEFKVFLKPEFAETDLTKAIPRSYIKDNYANLLFNIQRYFTYEGRYNKVYAFHFKLLFHLTGMISLYFPLFLYRSIAKMANKVQMKSQWGSIFRTRNE